MLNFVAEYGLFLAKAITIVLAIIVLVSFIVAASSKNKNNKERLRIKKINKVYEEYEHLLKQEILHKNLFKQLIKGKKKQEKLTNKKPPAERKRIFVLNFNGDIKAQATSSLREEITAILTVATPEDEVVLRLESPGGIVPNYGLAASQLGRLKEANVFLTVSVDKIAASGGYLMACVGNQILAAPYSIIGSIGVVAQMPNFHKLLKKHHIDFEQITAGEYKRTISLFGENTEKGREKVQEEIDSIHEIFKAFITMNRPFVNIDEVATGEHWSGVEALELQLVDKLTTSDDYLLTASKEKDIYEIHYLPKRSLASRLSLISNSLYKTVFGRSNLEMYS